MTRKTRNRWTRRQVLGAGAAAFAAPSIIPAHVLGDGKRPGANERVNVGIIGLGGRARDIAKTCLQVPALRVVSICDCFAPLCDAFIAAVGKGQKWNTYDDFHKMFDKEKLDGVMVETTTHARAWIVIQAMQAGLDVYIEKPMCLTITEGRYMVDAARRYNRVTQVGTQQRSMPINNWASDLVKNGAIGKVKVVLAPNFVGPDHWTPQPEQPMPKGGRKDWWDIWTNQAEFRPYHRSLHRGWARWWAYDGGGRCFGVTGWGTHSYDQIQRALGTDETGPVEVVLEEPVRNLPSGKSEVPKEEIDLTRLDYLIRLAKPVVGPRAKVRMRYANGTELRLHLDGDWGPGLGAIFIGEKGKIEINRNKIARNPKELADSPDNPGPITKLETQYHIENWVDCIKTREKCNADIEYGQRSTTLCYLVNIAREVGRVGEVLKWDPKTERFTNCPEANQSSYMVRPRRKGYELPPLT
ncbi:MAG: Gfo/Idh/MocA family oxidoreductase [Planctomycetes bacterium]|nr:Gfo/Idh/MocA family oxidoreductase [Planctomycetota bacterium]